MKRGTVLLGLGFWIAGCGGGGGSGSNVDAAVDAEAVATADASDDGAVSAPDSATTGPHDGAGEGGTDGPPAALDPKSIVGQAVSGSRLKARWIGPEGGTKVFAGWYDSMLAIPCTFTTLSDGKQHCIPAASYSSGLYSDDKCGKPVYAWAKDSCQPPSYVLAAAPNVCPDGYTIYQRKTKIAEILNYEKTSTGACKQGFALFNNDDQIYELEEVSPSMFVAADKQPGTAAGGLAPLIRQGADGSKSFGGWQDATTGTDCAFQSASDQMQRCLPTILLYSTSTIFSENTCKKVAAYRSTSNACPAPAYVLQQGSKACTTRGIVNKLGEKVKEGFYKDNAGACVAYPADLGYSFYAIGEEVPAATFPGGLTPGILPTDARLAAYGSSTPAGATAGSFYDQQMGLPCSSRTAGDGMVRCLPSGISSASDFKDSLCTEPLASGTICGPRLAYTTDTKTCPTQRHVFPLKDMYKGPTWFLAGASCVSSGSGTFYTLGDEIPAASFELVVTTTDP